MSKEIQSSLSQDSELLTLIERARMQSALAQGALMEYTRFNEAIFADQSYLLGVNQQLWQTLLPSMDSKTFQQTVLEKVTFDLGAIVKLNTQLAPIPAADFAGLTWALKSNKMENILQQAQQLIADDTIFETLLTGHFPEPFQNGPSFPVVIGELDDAWGNSQNTYLSAAIIEINLALLDQSSHVQDIISDSPDTLWLDNAAILHVTPIDQLVPEHAIIDFSPSSFYFSDALTPHGFAFIHSGYAFGGQRGENRYEYGKELGPQDCSSWLAKLIGTDYAFSTIDQLFTYRLSIPEEERGYIDPTWLESDGADTMQSLFTPVKVEDPLSDIQPGQVMAFRHFTDSEHQHSTGDSGHTILVIGLRENGNVVGLGYRRNMPEKEGFGIQEFPWKSTEENEVMFFNVNSPIALNDVLTFKENEILQTNIAYHFPDIISTLSILPELAKEPELLII